MLHPSIVAADPTAEPSPDSSAVEGPARGGPDSTAELGAVSSGGSTPPAGAGSVDAGSGPDATSGPDQAGGPSGSTGSTETSSEPKPGVIVRSSGGALTSGEQEQAADTTQNELPPVMSQSSSVVTAPAAEQVTTATEATPSAVAEVRANGDEAGVANRLEASVPFVRRAIRPVVAEISEIPPLTTSLSVVVGEQGSAFGQAAVSAAVAVKEMAAPAGSAVADVERATPASLRSFAGELAAALVPFVLPLPVGPVEESTLWAVLAWTRGQFDGNALHQRLHPVVLPRQIETVVADVGAVMGAAAPKATVDRVDRVTGRVTGRVNAIDVAEEERDGLTYALVRQLDHRLGVVTVDGATGRWTFAPRQVTRLAAHLDDGSATVTFGVAASNGQTIEVLAPVDPVEAAVTDTIETGDGLTYGLAVVGDRLCVLNGADDAAGNGRVKIIDTSTKAVIASVEVGSMPFALAAGGRSLYVGNADDGTVSVVDVASRRVVDVIDVGANPFGLEVVGDRLYVADHSGTVSVIDLNDNTELARIPIGGDPFGVAATADRVYVTNYAGGTLAVLDQATNTAVDTASTADSLDIAGYPYAASVVGARLYVVNSATNALTIVERTFTTTVDVDPHTRAIDAIPTGAAPVDMVVRGDRLYVSNVNSGIVTVVDVATNQPVASIGVGIQPGLMTATPDGRTIYVADAMSGTVRVITSVRHAANG